MRYGRYVGGTAVFVVLLRLCIIGIRAYVHSHDTTDQTAMGNQMPLMPQPTPMMQQSEARMQEMQSRTNADLEAARQRNQQMMDDMSRRQQEMRQRGGF